MQSFEDWLIGAASAVAVAGVMGAHLLAQPVVSDAVAAEPVVAAYTITVTAKRLAPVCKTAAGAAMVECQGAGAVTETLRAR
ncbi:MAG: hypothetical protein ACKVRO_06380 [Micropepsaceae bacterium]